MVLPPTPDKQEDLLLIPQRLTQSNAAGTFCAANPQKDGNPNTWFSTKTQISAVQEGETSAMAKALLERADEREGR